MKIGDAARVVRGFLDGDNGLLVAQLGELFRLDVDAIDDRIVVDHDRQVAGAGDGAEMLQRLAGIRLIDHARQYHQAVDADLLRVLGILAGERSGEFGNAGDDRHLATRHFLGGREDGTLLFRQQRAVLAASPQHDQAIHAGLQQVLDRLLGGLHVDAVIGIELRGDGGENARPVDGFGHAWLLFSGGLMGGYCIQYKNLSR